LENDFLLGDASSGHGQCSSSGINGNKEVLVRNQWQQGGLHLRQHFSVVLPNPCWQKVRMLLMPSGRKNPDSPLLFLLAGHMVNITTTVAANDYGGHQQEL